MLHHLEHISTNYPIQHTILGGDWNFVLRDADTTSTSRKPRTEAVCRTMLDTLDLYNVAAMSIYPSRNHILPASGGVRQSQIWLNLCHLHPKTRKGPPGPGFIQRTLTSWECVQAVQQTSCEPNDETIDTHPESSSVWFYSFEGLSWSFQVCHWRDSACQEERKTSHCHLHRLQKSIWQHLTGPCRKVPADLPISTKIHHGYNEACKEWNHAVPSQCEHIPRLWALMRLRPGGSKKFRNLQPLLWTTQPLPVWIPWGTQVWSWWHRNITS